MLEGSRKKGECLSDEEFIGLQNKYNIVYHELRDIGYSLCSEQKIRTTFFSFLKEYNSGEDLPKSLTDTTELHKDSVRVEILKEIVEMNEKYPFLIEEDLIAIIGKKNVQKFKNIISGSRGEPGNESSYQINPLPNQIAPNSNNLSSSFGLSKAINTSPIFLIDATAQFLVNRTKQELNTAFIEKFRNTYKKNWEFQTLFPKTNTVVLYNNPLNFTTWSSQLQLSIKKDVVKLPVSIASFIKKDKAMYDSLKPSEQEVLETTVAMLRTADLINQGYHPVQGIKKMYKKYIEKDSSDYKIHKAIAITHSVFETFSNNNEVLSTAELTELSRNERKLKAVSLLYTSQNKELLKKLPYNDVSLYSHLRSDAEYRQISGVIEVVKGLSEILNDQGRVINYNDIEHLTVNQKKLLSFNSMLPLIGEVSMSLYSNMQPEIDPDTESTLERSLRITESITDLNNNIALKNYKGAIFSLSSISILTIEGIINNLDESTNKKGIIESTDQLKKVIYWSGFIADFVSLKGENDLQGFLLKYATPETSYRTKRNHLFTISLNSYPGFFGGNEQRTLKSNFSTYNNSFALSAPIGICFTRGSQSGGTREDFDFIKNNSFYRYTGFSHGLFFPVLDIGAPFAYRWEKQTGINGNGFTEELKWSQLFSPGLYYQVGIKGSGLTLSLGGQMTPELRSINEDGLELQEQAWRFGLSAIYDIPVFNIWTSKR
jgi:hypothetical protein